MCTSFQEASLNALWDRVEAALAQYDVRQVILAGGVAANSRLREIVVERMAKHEGIDYIIPPLRCCTDNAAMIGASGYIAYCKGIRADYDIAATATMDL